MAHLVDGELLSHLQDFGSKGGLEVQSGERLANNEDDDEEVLDEDMDEAGDEGEDKEVWEEDMDDDEAEAEAGDEDEAEAEDEDDVDDMLQKTLLQGVRPRSIFIANSSKHISCPLGSSCLFYAKWVQNGADILFRFSIRVPVLDKLSKRHGTDPENPHERAKHPPSTSQQVGTWKHVPWCNYNLFASALHAPAVRDLAPIPANRLVKPSGFTPKFV